MRKSYGHLIWDENIARVNMIIPSKGALQYLHQTLKWHNFWSNRDIDMIFCALESWDFEFSKLLNYLSKSLN